MSVFKWKNPPIESDPRHMSEHYDNIREQFANNPWRWALVEEDATIHAGDPYEKRGLEVRRVQQPNGRFSFYARQAGGNLNASMSVLEEVIEDNFDDLLDEVQRVLSIKAREAGCVLAERPYPVKKSPIADGFVELTFTVATAQVS